MSFLPINEENKDAATGETTNAPGADTQTPAPPETGGSVGEQASGAPAKSSAGGTPTQFGSSASKLGDYLTANAPQIQGQADTLAGNLNTQYGDLNKGITDAANNFQSQVQGGYAANNPDAVNQAIADPAKFASDPNNVKAFQGQYNDTYTGPTNFEGTSGYSDLQNNVGQAVTQGNLLGTQAGLQSYLQGKGTNPTQAMSTLDSLLLRGNPEAQQKINTAAGQFGNLTGQLGTATTGADQSVADAQKAAAASQAYAQGQFNPYVQNFGNTINTGAAGAEANRGAYNTSAADYFQKGTAAGQALSGITGGTNYFAPQVAGLQPIQTPISAANFSTPEQYAQAAALQQLSGNNLNLPIDQTTAGQAGTAPAIPQGPMPDYLNTLRQYVPDITRGYQQDRYDASGGLLRPSDPSASGKAGAADKKTQDLESYLRSQGLTQDELMKLGYSKDTHTYS